MEDALASWDTRIATGPLNTWLTEVTAPHSAAGGGKQPRILFATPGHRAATDVRVVHHGFFEAGYGGLWSGGCETSGFTAGLIRSTCGCGEKRAGSAAGVPETCDLGNWDDSEAEPAVLYGYVQLHYGLKS